MKNGCFVVGGLIAALVVAGCSEAGNPFRKKQSKPASVSQAPPDPAPPEIVTELETVPNPASQVATGEKTPVDGSTNAAVLKYLSDLEAANAGSTAPNAADAPDAAPVEASHQPVASTAPTKSAASASAVRVNEALEIPRPEAGGAATGPALPRVVAVALVGDTSLAVEPEALPTVGAHRGLDVADAPAEISLSRLIEQAQKKLAEEPANAERQWRLSLLQLANGDPEAAAVLSPGLSENDRRLIGQLIEVARTGTPLLEDPLSDADATLAATGTLLNTIRQRAELQIPVVELCSRVTTFGVYDKMPVEQLRAYQANRVIVYCEVENFTVAETEGGGFRSLLSTRLELFTAAGRSVWTHEEESIEDNPKQRREDFFIAQLVTFPADLAPGDYVLKVTVTDTLGEKTNEGILDFTIGGVGSPTAQAP